MANDSHDNDMNEEIDDLASFGPLTSPDTEDSGFASGSERAEADLASLASSTKANQNGHPDPLSTEDESRVDLSQSVETIDEDTVPIQEAASEQIEQPSDTSREQPTPTTDTNARARFEPEPVDESRSNKSRTPWILVLSIGFIMGLTTASISIFIFISMDRFQSNTPLSESSPIIPNQLAETPQRVSQPIDSLNSQPAPSQFAHQQHANPASRPIPDPTESSTLSDPTNRRIPTTVSTRNRKRKPSDRSDGRISKRLVEKPMTQPVSTQPISTPDESPDQTTKDTPASPATATRVASSGKSPQPTANPQPAGAANADLDRIIDRVLDATEEDRLKRSAARKEDQKNAPQPSKELPLAPSREQVTEAMAVLLPAIRGCAKGLSGLATANIIVLNTGKVANVTVSGSPFAGTASGHCIEGVVRKARFPRFRQPSFRVRFPFSIRNVP